MMSTVDTRKNATAEDLSNNVCFATLTSSP